MEKVIIIEVCDQHGTVVERFRATKFPVRIGRAYDNDLIIDDPYVCPHHCVLAVDEAGTASLHDLRSVNGTYVLGESARAEEVVVDANSQLRIGHTQLRFKLPYQAIEPTRVDFASSIKGQTWPPRSLIANMALLLLAALVMTLNGYLDSYNAFEYGRYFFSQQIPALIAVAGWAAIWSIVSRITVHRFAFFRHAAILVSIMLVIYLSEYLLDFLKFGFASQWPFEMISIGVSAVALALLLFWHLRLCSEQKRSRLLMAASVVSVVFVGLVQINDYLDGREFRNGPHYPTNLKPPVFQMVKSKSVDDFMSKSAQLKKQIDKEIVAQRAVEHTQTTASRPE